MSSGDDGRLFQEDHGQLLQEDQRQLLQEDQRLLLQEDHGLLLQEDQRLLLHVCCGPCAAWPLGFFKRLGVDVEGLFYNPNIHPIEEFRRRSTGAEQLFAGMCTPLRICSDYMQSEWEAYGRAQHDGGAGERAQHDGYAGGLRAYESGAGGRCAMCYRLRLSYTARTASETGRRSFSTTLLISPYQNHDLIKAICEEQAVLNNVRFYYHDFRPHFREGQYIARELGIYRQKYCGCIYSVR